MHFNLREKALLHFTLDPAQHEGPHDLVQLFYYLVIFFLYLRVGLSLVVLAEVEPLIEVVRGGENLGQQKVK